MVCHFIDYYSQRIRRLTGNPPTAPPVISANGVVNAASFLTGAVSGGEIVAIFGQNLSSTTAVQSVPDVEFDTALVATRVRLLGTPTYLPVLAVSPGQVNTILPENLRVGGTAMIAVEVDGVASPGVTLQLAGAAPGIFTASGTGMGAGSMLNQDGTINSSANRAPAGTTIAAFGTGSGNLGPALYDGYLDVAAPYGMATNQVTATVGGAPATVVYAGGAPFLVAGVNQINITIPKGTASGAVPITLTSGNYPSNQVLVWVQ
jgi:uncharacterized protein (TIGR03437 family)